MGNQHVIKQNYGVFVGDQKQGETRVVRNYHHSQSLAMMTKNMTKGTLQELVLNAQQNYGSLPLLFARNKEKTQFEQRYTLNQAISDASKLSNCLIEKYFIKKDQFKEQELNLFGIWSKNRPEWFIADISSFLYGLTLVPLYDIFGPEQMTYCLEHSEITTLLISTENLTKFKKLPGHGNIKNLIILDDFTDQDTNGLDNINFFQFNDLLKESTENQNYPDINSDKICTFSYTSGTTGNPKGALISHKNFVSIVASNDIMRFMKVSNSDRHLSYLPLPHIMERVVECLCIFEGVQIYYFGGDILKLADDIRDCKPTIFISVPRLYQKFYEKINIKLNEAKNQSKLKKMLIEQAIQHKLSNLKEKAKYTSFLYDKLVFNKIKAVFGGEIKLMVTGSAPINQDVHNFLKIAFCCPILEGYGQTESTAATFITNINDPTNGHTGGVIPAMEYKLVDVPELNYKSTDLTDGKPTPRGEILFRGNCVFSGYFKEQEKTDETIVDGWLYSGDIGMINQESMSVRIIDRKKNIFKLQQGEYVAPEKIENTYLKFEGLQEIFIYGNSLESFCIGVMGFSPEYLQSVVKDLNLVNSMSLEEICNNEQVKAEVIKRTKVFAKENGLQSFEQAHKIILTHQPFVELQILTTKASLQRHKASKYFEEKFKEIYKAGF